MIHHGKKPCLFGAWDCLTSMVKECGIHNYSTPADSHLFSIWKTSLHLFVCELLHVPAFCYSTTLSVYCYNLLIETTICQPWIFIASLILFNFGHEGPSLGFLSKSHIAEYDMFMLSCVCGNSISGSWIWIIWSCLEIIWQYECGTSHHLSVGKGCDWTCGCKD